MGRAGCWRTYPSTWWCDTCFLLQMVFRLLSWVTHYNYTFLQFVNLYFTSLENSCYNFSCKTITGGRVGKQKTIFILYSYTLFPKPVSSQRQQHQCCLAIVSNPSPQRAAPQFLSPHHHHIVHPHHQQHPFHPVAPLHH